MRLTAAARDLDLTGAIGYIVDEQCDNVQVIF